MTTETIDQMWVGVKWLGTIAVLIFVMVFVVPKVLRANDGDRYAELRDCIGHSSCMITAEEYVEFRELARRLDKPEDAYTSLVDARLRHECMKELPAILAFLRDARNNWHARGDSEKVSQIEAGIARASAQEFCDAKNTVNPLQELITGVSSAIN